VTGAGWGGRLDRGTQVKERSADPRGPWMEGTDSGRFHCRAPLSFIICWQLSGKTEETECRPATSGHQDPRRDRVWSPIHNENRARLLNRTEVFDISIKPISILNDVAHVSSNFTNMITLIRASEIIYEYQLLVHITSAISRNSLHWLRRPPELQSISSSFPRFFRIATVFLVIQGKQNVAVICPITRVLRSTEIQVYVMP